MLLQTNDFDVLLFHQKDASYIKKRTGTEVSVPAENANGYQFTIHYFVEKGNHCVDWLHPVKITHRRKN